MKIIDRNFLLNPINRELLLVVGAGLLIAVAIITFAVMIASQI
ncbi:MAG: hypothetical protein UZ12_BCD005001052 [Bacteroidetes bacterium OLB12]|nr:MAG: hypothetical protein UZ12_BCD005001052 [Bacteroidetes bacterium OLB12]